jgi:hypothetical protein
MFRFLNILTKTVLLTLIGPSEVKVDLADFDLNLQENLLSTVEAGDVPRVSGKSANLYSNKSAKLVKEI